MNKIRLLKLNDRTTLYKKLEYDEKETQRGYRNFNLLDSGDIVFVFATQGYHGWTNVLTRFGTGWINDIVPEKIL